VISKPARSEPANGSSCNAFPHRHFPRCPASATIFSCGTPDRACRRPLRITKKRREVVKPEEWCHRYRGGKVVGNGGQFPRLGRTFQLVARDLDQVEPTSPPMATNAKEGRKSQEFARRGKPQWGRSLVRGLFLINRSITGRARLWVCQRYIRLKTILGRVNSSLND